MASDGRYPDNKKMIHPEQKLEEIGNQGKTELHKNRITIGLATCGISAGATPVYEALRNSDLPYEIDKTGCAGMCYAEPIVTVIQNGKKTIYGYVTEENIQELIE